MRKQRFWAISILSTLIFLNACRPAPSTPTPLASPTDRPQTPTSIPATPTPALPTATPLPTWPERWTPTGGPFGGLIEAIAVDPAVPGTVYAAGAGGVVYKSGDRGETWSVSERLAPPSCPFSSLIIDAGDSQSIYAVNACAGAFESEDAGSTWTRVRTGVDERISMLGQSPHAPGLLLAANASGQVYRSRDGASTWELVGDGLPAERICSLTASGPDTYWATTSNENDGTLYRFNAGRWAAVPFGQPPDTEATSVYIDPDNPNNLYVGLEKALGASLDSDTALLFRATDGGFNWTPLPNPPGRAGIRVQILGKARPSGVLYIARDSELLSSSDGGDTWKGVRLPGDAPISQAPRRPGGDFNSIAVDPANNDVLYLALGNAGIAKSVDGGNSWRIVNNGLNNTTISVIATQPTDPATLYAASANGDGPFKSSDYGDSWTRLYGGGLDHPWTDTLIVDPNHPDTLYQATDNGRVFRSDDGGISWAITWPDFRFSAIYALTVAPSDPNTLYANKNGFGLFRSDDGGASWRFLHGAPVDYTYALAVHPGNPDFVLSGENHKSVETSAQLYRSKDGGATWDVALDVPDATGVTSAAFDPRVEPYFARGQRPDDPTRLYAASTGPRGTLWFSNDAGDSWKPLNDDLNFSNVRALAATPHRSGVLYAGAWGGGTWRTEDSGQSWQRLPGDPAASAAAIAVDPSNHNIVYIADGTAPFLYRSTDDGNTWEVIFDAGPDYEQMVALALAPSDPSILYVSATKRDNDDAGAVFRIDANAPVGENDSEITTNLPRAPVSLGVHRRDPRRLFAVTHDGGVWKTVDDGASWRQVKHGLPEANFSQIVVDPILPETLFLAGGHAVNPETDLTTDELYGIWKSSDDGNTWYKVGGATFGRSSGPIQAITFHPEDQQVMYAVGDGGVYLSPDRGETWTNINGRLPFTPMNAVATDGLTLYAGSAGAGVFTGAIHPLIHTADWVRESHLSVPIAHIQITLHPNDPQTLYASAFPGGVFKTTDGGATWRECNSGLPSFAVADPARQGYYALAIAASDPEVLYLGLYGQGIYSSDDGATTWRPVHGEQMDLKDANVGALLVHSDDAGVVYIASVPGEALVAGTGVWHTADGGRSWSEFGQGLPLSGDVRTLAMGTDGQLYAGTGGYGLYIHPALYGTGDDTWQQLPALPDRETPRSAWDHRLPYQHTSLLVHPKDSNTLYAAAFATGIYRTTDNGRTWRERNVGFKNEGVLVLVPHPEQDQTLYAGTSNGIARSTDGGDTWHPWDAGWPPGQWVLSIAFDPTNPDVLYACSQNGADVTQTTEPAASVPDGAATVGGTVMKSTDGGATWFEMTTGLSTDHTFYQLLVDRFDPNVIYLATGQEGIYISRDGGDTWSTWNEGLWNRVAGGSGGLYANVLRFSADGRLLYFGTAGSGVWRRPAAGLP